MIGFDQAVIGICGLTSVWLSQDARPNVAKWACLFGLTAQPAWFYTTWQHQQWAIFALAFIYTVGWGRGVWNFWIKPRLPAKRWVACGETETFCARAYCLKNDTCQRRERTSVHPKNSNMEKP